MPSGFSSPRRTHNDYELESRKSHIGSFSRPEYGSHPTYGIAVTIDKVIERVEDPLPTKRDSGSDGDSKSAINIPIRITAQ